MSDAGRAAAQESNAPFNVVEAGVADIHGAFRSGQLSARALVQSYLDRIQAYDQSGPALNAVIALNPNAIADAEALDAAMSRSGPVGPLHGIPVIVKDQVDVKGLPTTLGSVLFRHFRPDRDAFVVKRLRSAGAVILAKATLGELGGGDTHGSLFGSTRNPYDLNRTPGGSSGGSAACVAANFATLAIGQEGLASIRRPAAWCALAGMRPSAGLVSRAGVYGGWPGIAGSLGPMARSVRDLAVLLDVMVGYDPDDPATAAAAGKMPASFANALDAGALNGARLGILREPMGLNSEPESEDFREIGRVFARSIAELKAAGAEIVDPVVIPDLKMLLATRPGSFFGGDRAFAVYMGRNSNPPYRTLAEAMASPDFAKVDHRAQRRWTHQADTKAHYEFLLAREAMMFNLLKVMADHRLDAIVHKAVEHSPTLIKEGTNPPFVDQKGAPHINTFLALVPSIVVPAGFTRQNLPAGLCFLGKPYDDANMIRLAYAYEQATRHRRPPASTPGV
jgi:Asp-tRNA(Asn)/Glu-tRNA(Gln) amidotransferase A subunit family amidase